MDGAYFEQRILDVVKTEYINKKMLEVANEDFDVAEFMK